MASRLLRWFQAAPTVLKQAAAAFLVRQIYGTMPRFFAVLAVLLVTLLGSLALFIGFFRWFQAQLATAWDYWATVLPSAWLMPLVFWSIAGPLALRLVWVVSFRIAEATENVPPMDAPQIRLLLESRLKDARFIARFDIWEQALIVAAFDPQNISQAHSLRLNAVLKDDAPIGTRSTRL